MEAKHYDSPVQTQAKTEYDQQMADIHRELVATGFVTPGVKQRVDIAFRGTRPMNCDASSPGSTNWRRPPRSPPTCSRFCRRSRRLLNACGRRQVFDFDMRLSQVKIVFNPPRGGIAWASEKGQA